MDKQLRFIQKATAKYQDEYDYSLVEYKSSNEKIKIICNKCKKVFYQTPSHHLEGRGCPTCKKQNLCKSLQQFIIQAKKVHSNKYNYDKVVYNGNKNKIQIFCNECKKYFWQIPTNHLKGCGCKHCGIKQRSSKRIYTTEDFIKKAISIHGNKYNYNQVNYINSKTKVKIYCNKCKCYFEQLPAAHLSGQGCFNCCVKNRGKSKRLTMTNFIQRAKKIHKDKYDYSKVIYVTENTKVKIYCNKCNRYFLQTPSKHLQGQGCPRCNISKGELHIDDWLKEHNIPYMPQYRFFDCKDKKPLPFDFYIPDHNMCIEFQGQQHYDIYFYQCMCKQDINTATKVFNKVILHDKIKREYCQKNNIKFLEIKTISDVDRLLTNTLL